MAKFIDNTTPLNAENLNPLENIPIYNAALVAQQPYRTYRAANVMWDDLPIGAIFAIILDVSTKGTTNEVVSIEFGMNNARHLFYNNFDDVNVPITKGYYRVNDRKYLEANRPYIFKKYSNTHGSPMLVILEQYDTAKLGATLDIDGNTVHLKNLDGTSISNISLSNISSGGITSVNNVQPTNGNVNLTPSNIGAAALGTLKVGNTEYTLRTGAAGAAGYLTLVLE